MLIQFENFSNWSHPNTYLQVEDKMQDTKQKTCFPNKNRSAIFTVQFSGLINEKLLCQSHFGNFFDFRLLFGLTGYLVLLCWVTIQFGLCVCRGWSEFWWPKTFKHLNILGENDYNSIHSYHAYNNSRTVAKNPMQWW